MAERICEVGVEQIRVSPFQPRRQFSEQDLEELASSIKSVGLIQPPVVRTIEQGGKVLYYELIAGERRWRAAQKAGLKRLNVIVRDSSDQEAAKSTLIENVQRVDLNPIEVAEAFRRLIEVFGMTQEEVAEKVGKKRSTIANYLRLLTLADPIKEELICGGISMGHAKALLSLESPDLREALHALILKNGLNVREAEREGQKINRQKKRPAADLTVIHLQERLQNHLRTKVEVHHGSKGGKIALPYSDLDDLERLLMLLGLPEE